MALRIKKNFIQKKHVVLAVAMSAIVSSGAMAQPNPQTANEVIVKFDAPYVSGLQEADRLSNSLGRHFSYETETATGRLIFSLNERQSIRAMEGISQAIRRLSGVVYAEANRLNTLSVEPNDTYLSSNQWHYYGPLQGEVGGLNVVDAWSTLGAPPSMPALVAILDTGQTQHPDLDANTLPGTDMISYLELSNDGNGRDSDPSDPGDNIDPADPSGSSWHGTHVAGTVAAVTNNGVGVAGVGLDRVKVIHVRVLGVGGGYSNDIADGIVWAADNGAQVINMSLGGQYQCAPNSLYQEAINYAVAKNVSVVVSAGNANVDTVNFSPASCANVINVAAVGPLGTKASYSNYGDLVDISAPGGDGSGNSWPYVASTHNTGITSPGSPSYVGMMGTSMAAPHISGLVALMHTVNSSLSPLDIENALKGTARPISSCSSCGAGIADAVAAIANVDSGGSGGGPALQPPSAPSYLTALVDGAVVNLIWGQVSNADVYELEFATKLRGRNYSDFTVIDNILPSDAISASHQPGNGTFQYRLRASNEAGSSDWIELIDPITVESGGTDGGGGATKCHPKKGC